MTETPEPAAAESPTITTPFQRRVAIALLLVGAVCAGMGQTIVFSVLPPLAREIGLTNLQVGTIFMISATAWVICGPYWGRMSDDRGRKPFILIGMSGFAVSTALFGGSVDLGLAGALSGAPLYVLMIATRSLYGLFGSASPPAAQAYIADRTTRANRTAGIASFSAAFGFGALLGPGFGAALSMIGPVAPFYAMSAIAFAMTFAVLGFLPERTGPKLRSKRTNVKITDRRLTPFLIFALTFGVINAVPIQTIAFYFIDRLGYSTAEAAGYVSIGLTASAVASLSAQLGVVQRMKLAPATLMRAAPVLLIAGHSLILLNDHLWPVVIGMMASGFGAGLAIPASTAAASIAVEADEQGGAIGLANSAGASGFILSPVIAFTLYDASPAAPYMLTAAMATGLLAYAWESRAVGDARAPHTEELPEEAVSEPTAAPYQ